MDFLWHKHIINQSRHLLIYTKDEDDCGQISIFHPFLLFWAVAFLPTPRSNLKCPHPPRPGRNSRGSWTKTWGSVWQTAGLWWGFSSAQTGTATSSSAQLRNSSNPQVCRWKRTNSLLAVSTNVSTLTSLVCYHYLQPSSNCRKQITLEFPSWSFFIETHSTF